ncbi:transglutaminase-like domain-containing protein [Paracoccus sulfuroxidans]|uniref:Transglutaminase-like putative cysteine protease n=1 Tax=Paracoccus sulfuroxidans TaxID=384678 RepID=A0A562NYA5_9RHOB|nr:transglutaminase family protein [Paracoccus sulfuroxidans]TWI37174.1 transglutaminase-like putative cysteine protease [Paracoccus sulfuroxidans]
MLIRYGYRITLTSDAPLPMVTQMSALPERRMDLRHSDAVHTHPQVPMATHLDAFGNLCTRMTSPGGRFSMSCDAVISDSGLTDIAAPETQEDPVPDLPDEVLTFLLPSRYCESDLLGDLAWQNFGDVTPGWTRVQRIADWVHGHIAFDYQAASPTRTALGAYKDRKGVCRDYTHLAIAICRALNIPARYVNGYLGDIGVPPDPAPMDFAAWMQVWLSGRWWNFDPRNNMPRTGRIITSIGRDACDVALITSFGQHRLVEFKVWTDEITEAQLSAMETPG